MRKYFCFFCLIFFSFGFSQNTKLVFDYDGSGNQIFRGFIDEEDSRNQRQLSLFSEKTNLIDDNIDSKPILSASTLGFTYYPNPVRDFFTITWPMPEVKVESIRVYTTSGQLVNTVSKLRDKDQTQLDFSYLPIGWYRIVCVYNDVLEVQFQVIKK